MWGRAALFRLVLTGLLGLTLAGCGATAATPAPGVESGGSTASGSAEPSGGEGAAASKEATPAGADEGEGVYAAVDVCKLVTPAEITAVMGVDAHDPEESMMGPGASIAGAKGCFWSLGDSIDIFDLWIYPTAAADLRTTLDDFWADGYAIEPLPGVGDEAVAAVWRGDDSVRTVGQVAGVGVRQGGKTVLLTTLRIGEDYLDPKPAAQLALKILGRF